MPIPTMMRARLFATGVALSLISLHSPAEAAQCQIQIDQELQRMEIPQDDVESIKVMRRGKGAKSASNYTLDAWIRLKSCDGYLMIAMTRYCMVQQSYTTGDCRVGGMPGY